VVLKHNAQEDLDGRGADCCAPEGRSYCSQSLLHTAALIFLLFMAGARLPIDYGVGKDRRPSVQRLSIRILQEDNPYVVEEIVGLQTNSRASGFGLHLVTVRIHTIQKRGVSSSISCTGNPLRHM
jgi:hypothetical protein